MLDIFIKVSGVLLPVFFIMGLGAYFMYTKTLSEQGNNNLKNMVYNVLMPIMVFTYLVNNPVKLHEGLTYMLITFGYATVLTIGGFLLVYRFMYTNRLAIFSTATFIFPNNIYLGIPICMFAFGDVAIVPAIMVGIMFYALPLYVLIAIKITDTDATTPLIKRIWGAFWSIFSNPTLIGVLMSIIWIQFDISIPTVMDRTFNLVSNANKMLALLTVGASLYSIYHDKTPLNTGGHISFKRELIYANIIKLIGLPILSLLVIINTNVPPVWQAVFVLQSATPLGVFVYFIACAEGLYIRKMAVHVFISTVLSMFTMPLFIILLWRIFDV